MSSTTSTDTSLPSASSSLPTPPPNQLASGANYFFGFLIAFIAFLFVFLSLGLLARRRRMRLMRDFMLYGPDDSDLPNILQTEPVMWEPLYAEAKAQLWSQIMPLSTSLVRREVLDDKTPAEVPPPRPSRNPFVVYFGFPPSKLRRTGPNRILVTEAMNVCVMITMPQVPDSLEEDDRNEYQIGMLQIPWKDENLPQT